jgi:2-oxoglutarate ferredoxin oxidoreductase subunit alpha
MKKGQARVMQGNEACVEAAILAGCRFFAGYPITPANEITEGMARRLPLVDGIFMQVEDEITAIVSLVGASWGGSKAMTATSGPGFCLMQEGIGLAASIEAPCVIVNVQRGGPASGQSTSPSQGDVYQARYGSNGDYSVIVLAPSTAQEMFDFTIKAFNLSEQFRIPVIVLSDEVVAHIREKVFIPDHEKIEIINRKRPQGPKEDFLPFKAEADGVPPMPSFNDGYKVVVISQVKGPSGKRGTPQESEESIRRLTSKVENCMDEFADVRTYRMEGAELAIVSYGSVSRAARSAADMAREEGIQAGCVEMKTLWPFHEDQVRRALGGIERIVVVEMNLGKIFREVERAIRLTNVEIELLSKVGGGYPHPQEILNFIRR